MYKKHPSKACRLRVGLNLFHFGGGGGGAPIPTITPLHSTYFKVTLRALWIFCLMGFAENCITKHHSYAGTKFSG